MPFSDWQQLKLENGNRTTPRILQTPWMRPIFLLFITPQQHFYTQLLGTNLKNFSKLKTNWPPNNNNDAYNDKKLPHVC